MRENENLEALQAAGLRGVGQFLIELCAELHMLIFESTIEKQDDNLGAIVLKYNGHRAIIMLDPNLGIETSDGAVSLQLLDKAVGSYIPESINIEGIGECDSGIYRFVTDTVLDRINHQIEALLRSHSDHWAFIIQAIKANLVSLVAHEIRHDLQWHNRLTTLKTLESLRATRNQSNKSWEELEEEWNWRANYLRERYKDCSRPLEEMVSWDEDAFCIEILVDEAYRTGKSYAEIAEIVKNP